MDTKKEDLEKESKKANLENLNQIMQNAFVYKESAYRNQLNFRNGKLEIPRASEKNPLTIDEILQLITPQLEGKCTGNGYIYKSVNGEVNATHTTQKEELLKIDPFKVLAEDYEANYTFSIEYKGPDDKLYYLHLYLRGLAQFEYQWYARMSVLKSHEGEDDLRSGNTESHPELLSFLMVYDLEGAEKTLDEFDAISISADQNLKERKPINDTEMEVLNGRIELYSPFYYFEFGKALFAQERYYDAYTNFKRAYNILKGHFFYSDENERGTFFGICYHLGLCLVEMHAYEQACYYLGLAYFGTNHHEAEYANALALAGHERVVYFINKLKDSDNKETNEEKIKALRTNYAKAGEKASNITTFKTGVCTLGVTLNHFFDICKDNLSTAVVEDKKNKSDVQILKNADEVWNLNLSTINDVVINLGYEQVGDGIKDKSSLSTNNTIIVNIDSISSGEKPMKRVNIMIPNFAFDDHKRVFTPINNPRCCSFVIADTPESKIFTKDQLFDLLNEAVAIGNEGRIYESLLGMSFIHNHLKEAYLKSDASDEIEELFYVSTFRMGSCMNELLLFEKGFYCLDWSNESQIDVNIHEFINGLCAMNDVRALYFLDRYINGTKAPEDQQYMDRYNQHMIFLKERKAILLLENQLFNDAEKWLNEMVNDPLTKEFAETQLKQLQAFKEQNQQPDEQPAN